MNNYEITRAKMISEKLGYIAFTADIYGADMHDIQDFQVKVEQATKYRSDPALFNSRIQSAINTVKGMPFVDVNRVAIIGYCLGGTGVLGYSFSNTMNSTNDIVGGVSFHGGLMDFDVTGEMASPVLVLSGGNDDAGTAVEDLESRLKEANATWQITRYSGEYYVKQIDHYFPKQLLRLVFHLTECDFYSFYATTTGVYHGFTKFDADAYNEWVDSRSWKEMSSFLAERFGEIEYGTKEPSLDMEYSVPLIDPADVGLDTEVGRARMSNTEESMVMVETVAYDADGFALEGYLALPPMDAGEQRPGLVILPDWDGVNGPTGYEAERAVMAAKEGRYVAMVADIYGAEFTNVDDRTTRVELATKYRSDPELFVSRIQAGIDQLMAHEAVDSNLIFVAGYCFGGTGAIDYAFSSGALKNVKAVVPIHGGLNPLRAIQTDVVQPYILILSGGVDDAHGNTTELEAHLDGASATWEISRYSSKFFLNENARTLCFSMRGAHVWNLLSFCPKTIDAQHGFTKWDTNPMSRYDAMADSRSWWSMMSLMDTLSSQAETVMESEEEDDHDHDKMEDSNKMGDSNKMEDSSANGLSVVSTLAMAAFVAAAMW